jgi:F-type H+-transporting ATPase subunit a
LNINVTGPKKAIPIGDTGYFISETLLVGWIIMIVLFIVVLWLTNDLKKKPTTKKQAFAEFIVETVNNLVDENLGTGMRAYAPYMAALLIFAITGALIGMLGFRPMDVDIGVTATWAGMTFFIVLYNNIKCNGLGGYLKGLATPIPMTPMNIISEFASPVSLALRLFANISVGMLIFQVLYGALVSFNVQFYNWIGINVTAENSYFNFFQIGVPALLSFYFDLFSGTIQSFVFMMLTMAYIKNARGED